MKKSKVSQLLALSIAVLCLSLALAFIVNRVSAHKVAHDAETLQAFTDEFMAQVIRGDNLFHGVTEPGINLSSTGMSCAMCHPFAADVHPHEYPKFQEQMSEFATLRDMINWCIEKPNEGERIDPNGEAMKALEAYIYWSNRGSVLDPGRH